MLFVGSESERMITGGVLTVKEVAERLHIDPSKVEKILQGAIKKMREKSGVLKEFWPVEQNMAVVYRSRRRSLSEYEKDFS